MKLTNIVTSSLFASLSLLLPSCHREDIVSPLVLCETEAAINSVHPKAVVYTAALEEHRLLNNIPGAVMLIKTPANGIWAGASGKANLEQNTAVGVCDQFRVGSVAKPFIATLVMQLKDEHRLSLEQTLAQLLPEYKHKIPQADKITVRQLLNHTSGIVNIGEDNPDYVLDVISEPEKVNGANNRAMLQKYVVGQDLYFYPGSGFHYSNSNYMLLGLLVERLEQKPLQLILWVRIMKPLQMYNTYIEKRDDSNLVTGYSDFFQTGELLETPRYDRITDGSFSGGLVSTAGDLLRFSEGLFGGKLVSQASLQEMMDWQKLPTCENGDCMYGLGLEQWHDGVGHEGETVGSRGLFIYYPETNSHLILLANKGGGTMKEGILNLMKQ